MKAIHNRNLLGAALIAALAVMSASSFAAGITPGDARAIAKEAYIYGFPMVDGYRIQYAYYVDRNNPEFKVPWNEVRNMPLKRAE